MGQVYTLAFSNQNCAKTTPFGEAHAYMAFLREYPPRKQLGPDAGYLGLSIVNLMHSYSLQLLFIIKRSSEFMIIIIFQCYICYIILSAKSSLRNCLDTQLLRRHNLIVPEDFSSEEMSPKKAPQGQS